MSLIYEPKGKAREYSPLALNVYSGGCDHACRYCYCAGIQRGKWGTNPRPRDLSGLAREAAKARRQVLLCFMGDPYCIAETHIYRSTRAALMVLRDAGCSVAILTKGGTRCLYDFGLFADWPEGRIKVGATLTFESAAKSAEWERFATTPKDRITALRELHRFRIKTWASIEPVIEPAESLAVIEASLPYVDAYKVGKWNHDKRAAAIDWPAFGRAAVEMIRAAGKRLYVKADLRTHLEPGYLTPAECDMDALTLPDRPEGGQP